MERSSSRDVVSWIDGAPTPNEECRVVRDVLVGRQLTRFDVVAETVASELLSRDCRRAGGNLAAMEPLRAWYVVAARRLLQSQNGICVRITPAGDDGR